MEKINLDKYKTAWKDKDISQGKTLSKEDLQKYLAGKSKDINSLFRKGLIMDLALKSILSISFIGIIIIYLANKNVVIWISLILIFTLAAMYFQYRSLILLSKSGAKFVDIKSALQSKLDYYYGRHIKSLLVGALSNSLLIVSGAMYFFFARYGGLRKMDTNDFIVFGAAILIGFIFGALLQLYHHNFHIKQLKECLDEIDRDSVSEQIMEEQRIKRRRMTWIAILAIICGLLLLSYLIAM